jgi:hypothetical protein
MPLRTLTNQNGDMIPVLKVGCASGVALVVGSTATHTATTGFKGNVVRISTDIGICFRFHNSATETLAATTDHRLPANSVESFDISDMGSPFLSVRTTTGTATGNLGMVFVSEAV